uniref:DUF676 domain-containing protein n=1 Tax=Aegilops tauschii TaxID=37682 RepID=N1R209_AEGTA
MHKLTLDGIDVMGERLAQEVSFSLRIFHFSSSFLRFMSSFPQFNDKNLASQVIEEINKRPQITKISFVAHSVGGLVARYAIGRLYRPPGQSLENSPQSLRDSNRGNIHGLDAVNFITVASPHLGSRGNKQVPFLFGVTAIEKFACCIIHFIFRRTGKHLFLTDNDDGKPPLLQLMVDDCGDLRFMTSSIRGASELPKWVDSTSKVYPHIVYEELSKAETLDQCADVADMDKDNCTLEERLLRGLKRVSWEKVDVSFHNSKARSAAHSVIQVRLWLSSAIHALISTALMFGNMVLRLRCCLPINWNFEQWTAPHLWKQRLCCDRTRVANCGVAEPGEHVYGNPRNQVQIDGVQKVESV